MRFRARFFHRRSMTLAWLCAANSLLRADASLDRDASPLLDVATDAFGERFGRAGFRRHALRDERLGPVGGLEDFVHLAIEPRENRRRGGGRHDERNPQGGFVT